jgi:hypothetical protein
MQYLRKWHFQHCQKRYRTKQPNAETSLSSQMQSTPNAEYNELYRVQANKTDIACQRLTCSPLAQASQVSPSKPAGMNVATQTTSFWHEGV